MFPFIFTILFITIHVTTPQQILNISIDEECLTQTNKSGICRPIDECSSVRGNIKNRQLPTICSFDGDYYERTIVCCTETQKKHVEKCKEFASHVFQVTESLPRINPTYKNISTCVLGGKALIMGRERATISEYPHMALIGYKFLNDQKKWICEGSLISKRFVLTSAKCLNHKTYGEASFVRLGDNERNLEYVTEIQYFDVIERIAHPDYQKSSLYNDIGLLKLNKEILISVLVRPICLYDSNVSPKTFITSGWGVLGKNNVSSSDLQHVVMNYYPEHECNRSYNDKRLNQGIIAKSQICTVIGKYEQHSCGRLSGGPLQIYHKNMHCMYQLVGVRSFGNNCQMRTKPEVYTKVSFYLRWIEKTIWE